MHFQVYLFIYALFCARLSCASAKALIGENVRRAAKGEFPFIAAIVRINPANPFLELNTICTGSLITQQSVLTASHCLSGENVTATEIIIGSANLYQGTKYLPSWWITYNNWALTQNFKRRFAMNDIAIIKLMKMVPHDIQPATISTLKNTNLFGLNASTVGWGRVINHRTPVNLHKITLKIMPNDECSDRATSLSGQYILFHRRIICTYAVPFALLHDGDSGGPLLYENRIVGINSGTSPLPQLHIHPEKLNVHFSASFYRKFIQWYQYRFVNALLGINVKLVKNDEFLFVASLSKLTVEANDVLVVNHFCTGALITRKDVVTAEHCLLEKELTDIRVIVGSTDVRLGKRHQILRWLSYNQWIDRLNAQAGSEKHDVAVARLTDEVSNNIQPVRISSLTSSEIIGTEVIASGWGSSNVFVLPILMETVNLKIMTNQQCEQAIRKVQRKKIPVPQRILCSSSMPPAIVTYGDSGGPILYNDTLVGVTIGTCLYKGQPAHPGKINLHSAIDYYKSFITQAISDL